MKRNKKHKKIKDQKNTGFNPQMPYQQQIPGMPYLQLNFPPPFQQMPNQQYPPPQFQFPG